MPATIATPGLGWRSRKYAAIVLLAIAMIWLGVVSRPIQANAWTPTCTGWSSYYDSRGRAADVPTVGYGTYNSNCLLGYGATGGGVSTLQFTLNNCYNKGLVVDGIFGLHTKTALQQVQSSLKINADGIYGPQTRDAMNHDFWYPTYPWPVGYVCHRLGA